MNIGQYFLLDERSNSPSHQRRQGFNISLTSSKANHVDSIVFILIIQVYSCVTQLTVEIPFLIFLFVFPSLFALILIALHHIKPQTLGIQIQLIPSTSFLQNLRNSSCVLDSLQVNVRSGLLNGVTNQLRRAGFSLRANHHGLLFLACFIHDECCSLSFLLGDLLGFDGGGKFRREGKVLKKDSQRCCSNKSWSEVWRENGITTYSKGDIVEDDVKSCSSLREVLSDKASDILTLGDQLAGIKLSHYAFQNLVHDGWQNSFVIIRSESPVNLWEGLNSWS